MWRRSQRLSQSNNKKRVRFREKFGDYSKAETGEPHGGNDYQQYQFLLWKSSL